MSFMTIWRTKILFIHSFNDRIFMRFTNLSCFIIFIKSFSTFNTNI